MELQIDTRNVEMLPDWEAKIEEEKARLGRHHPDLVHHLRVSIEGTAHSQDSFSLRIVASVPNNTLVVKRKGETVKSLIVDAFDTLGLQLKELQRKKRKDIKVQEGGGAQGLEGIVKSLFPYESYGFIASEDGRDVYFHENALKDVTMEQLKEGDEVRFGEGSGVKGPTAAWVRLQSK